MEKPDLSIGVLLRSLAVTTSGASTKIAWKSWSDKFGNPLRWQLRRIFPSLGLEQTSKGTAINVRLKMFKARWSGLLAHLGVERFAAHYGDSPVAENARKGVEAEGDSDCDYWASTCLLTAFQLQWRSDAASRCRGQTRDQVASCLNAFVEAVVRGDVAAALIGQEVVAADADLCILKAEAPVCICLRNARAAAEHRELASPQRYLCEYMDHLFSQLTCPSATAHLAKLIQAVAIECDGSVGRWRDFAWHKTEEARLCGPSGRSLRDFHAQQFVMRGGAKPKRLVVPAAQVSKLEGAHRTLAFKWTVSELCAVQASTWTSMASADCIGLMWDAGRLGRPAKEMNFILAENLDTADVHFLAPSVFIYAYIYKKIYIYIYIYTYTYI